MLKPIKRKSTRMSAVVLALAIGASPLAVAQDWRYNDHDRDGYRYDRDGDRYDHDDDRNGDRYDRDDDRDGMRVARHFGFQDGISIGREDRYQRKPQNPYPRGKYAHEDRGYHHEYGDKYGYKAEYARAYREGYERAYR